MRSVGLNPATIPIMNLITGWELVVYEPPRIELVTGEISIESVESSSDLGVGMDAEEPVPSSIFTEGIDDDEPIIRLERTLKTTPQSTLKPGVKPQRKSNTTPNVPLKTLLYRCQARSSGPAPVLPLPKDTVDNPATKKKTA